MFSNTSIPAEKFGLTVSSFFAIASRSGIWLSFFAFCLLSNVFIPFADIRRTPDFFLHCCLAVSLPVIAMRARDFGRILSRPPVLFFLFYMTVTFLASLRVWNSSVAFLMLYPFLCTLFLSTSMALCFDAEAVTRCLIAALAIKIIASIALHVLGLYDGYYFPVAGRTVNRFSGFFGGPNRMAEACALCLIMQGIFFASAQRLLRAPVRIAIFCLPVPFALWGLVAAASRTALVSMLVTLIGCLLLTRLHQYSKSQIRFRHMSRILVSGILMIVVLFAITVARRPVVKSIPPPGNSYTGITGSETASGQSTKNWRAPRLRLWSFALSHVLARPVTGYGMGASLRSMPGWGKGRRHAHAHNAYIQAFIYAGVLGGAFFLILISSSAVMGAKGFLKNGLEGLSVFAPVMFYGAMALALNVILAQPDTGTLMVLASAALAVKREISNTDTAVHGEVLNAA